MKLIIDIPEDDYELVQKYIYPQRVFYELVHGTPIPDNATNGDLISRQAVLDNIDAEAWEYTDYINEHIGGNMDTHINMFADNICERVNELSPVNSQEPKTGHWIEIAQYSDGNHKIECSECESYIFDRGHANSFNVKNKYKYCPNCGARMGSEDKV